MADLSVRHDLVLLAPAALLIGLFLFIPTAEILSAAFFGPDLTDRYVREVVQTPVYINVLMRTFTLALVVAVGCLLLGYPCAYAITVLSRRARTLILFVLIIPLWISILVRTFAWMALLGRTGFVNELLIAIGFIDQPLTLLFNWPTVVLAMVQICLPLMILTCYGVMITIDRNLVNAARAHGAGAWAAFRHVFLPLSASGAVAGFSLVFVLSVGFFVTPALLGGRRELMIGNLIEQEIRQSDDWGLAAMLAVMLLAAAFLALGVIRLLTPRTLEELK